MIDDSQKKFDDESFNIFLLFSLSLSLFNLKFNDMMMMMISFCFYPVLANNIQWWRKFNEEKKEKTKTNAIDRNGLE